MYRVPVSFSILTQKHISWINVGVSQLPLGETEWSVYWTEINIQNKKFSDCCEHSIFMNLRSLVKACDYKRNISLPTNLGIVDYLSSLDCRFLAFTLHFVINICIACKNHTSKSLISCVKWIRTIPMYWLRTLSSYDKGKVRRNIFTHFLKITENIPTNK